MRKANVRFLLWPRDPLIFCRRFVGNVEAVNLPAESTVEKIGCTSVKHQWAKRRENSRECKWMSIEKSVSLLQVWPCSMMHASSVVGWNRRRCSLMVTSLIIRVPTVDQFVRWLVKAGLLWSLWLRYHSSYNVAANGLRKEDTIGSWK